MAAKNTPTKTQNFQKDRVLIKWVRKAGMYCKTSILNGKQTQEWTQQKPNN